MTAPGPTLVPSQGRSTRCTHCGGAVPITVLAPVIRCPFCRASLQVPAELLAELQAYERRVGSAHHEAESHANLAEQYTRWINPSQNQAKMTLVAIGLVIGAPLLVSALGATLVQAKILPASVLSIGTMVVSMGGIVAYAVWYYSGWGKRRATAEKARPAAVRCPQCGADNLLQPGQVQERCRYCSAGLLPSATVMRDVVADAERAARRALMQRYRAERNMMAYYRGFSAQGYMPFLAVGPMALMLGFAAIGLTVEAINGKNTPIAGLLIVWAITLGLAGGLFGYFAYRRNKRAAWFTVMDAVARPLGGTAIRETKSAVDWLNAYWAGPIAGQAMFTGDYFHAAAGLVAGYPFLVWADPVAASSHYSRSLHVYLAAWFPGFSDGERPPPTESDEILRIRMLLQQNGFSCLVNSAGITATGSDAVLRALHSDPDPMVLVNVVWSLGRMARAIGGLPAEVIP